MLIDTSLTIAYKCPSCGTFEFLNISLFKLFYKKTVYLVCRCGRSGIMIKSENIRIIRVHIPCMACGGEHSFVVDRKAILNRDIQIFNCPETAIQQCFIGSDVEVRKRIDLLEKELDELINTFGYEDYFMNTQVMFDVLNRIHDIAEQGNLFCECGNNDIELSMLPDSIQLKCKRCSGQNVIQAASNEDLKQILKRQHIFLVDKYADFSMDSTEKFI